MSSTNSILKTIQFSEFSLWDVKRFLANQIESNYPIVRLGDYINQRSQKIKLNEFPDQSFGILGVSNQTGIFDAYTEKGENINQPYQEVYLNDLAYNPYRINVGSIGLKTLEQNNLYISPAYVVFECRKGLEAAFLFKMFKTDTFNQIIKDNTTGSVRQNLRYDILEEIKIPLPTLIDQNRLIDSYNSKISQAVQQERQALELEQSIEDYLFSKLGIKRTIEEKKQFFRTISFEEIEQWSVDTLGKVAKIADRFKGHYELIAFKQLINLCQYGLSEKAHKTKTGYPILRMNNILNAELITHDLKYISISEQDFKKFQLKKGDLLFNRTNSKELVGKTAIFDLDSKDFTFASYLIRVEINDEIASKEYVNYLFNSSILQYQKDLVSRQVTGQANINAQEMQTFLFPLPPLPIQEEIANHISDIKERIRNLKDAASQNRQTAITDFEKEIFKV